MVRYFVNDKECTYEEFCEQVQVSMPSVPDLSLSSVSALIDILARTNEPKIINSNKFEVDADFNYVLVAMRAGTAALVASFNSKERLIELKEELIEQWKQQCRESLSESDVTAFTRDTSFYVAEVLNYE